MKPKGSTVCIAVMFIGWTAYVIAQGWYYAHFTAWLPMEITWGTIGLFLVETVSLARLKMAKEGQPIKDKIVNPMLKKLGVELPDFEAEVQLEAAKQEKERTNDGRETDEPEALDGDGGVPRVDRDDDRGSDDR